MYIQYYTNTYIHTCMYICLRCRSWQREARTIQTAGDGVGMRMSCSETPQRETWRQGLSLKSPTSNRTFIIEMIKCDREFNLEALTHPEYSAGMIGPRVVLGDDPVKMHREDNPWRVPIKDWPMRPNDLVD